MDQATALLSRLTLLPLSGLLAASLRPRWLAFRAASRDPAVAQQRRLRAIVQGNASTAFGREHRFHRIDSPAAFQRRVPVRDYAGVAPWIERVCQGEPQVLTTAPVRRLAVSGGSTAAHKLIPCTQPLLDEISAATGPWLYDLHRRCPGLLGRTSYWSISPASHRQQRTAGGIPIGFEDDLDYFPPWRRWALGKLMAVPSTVARIRDMDRWRDATLRHLLADHNLGLLSVWSPTFLTALMDHLDRHRDRLLRGLPPRRARSVRGGRPWPNLALISCWADGHARSYVGQLERWFRGTPIQPKGLIATEGVISFPLWGQRGSALAVTSHFLEFLDLQRPDDPPLLAHQLRPGADYSPLLTTGGGLYRYHLKDTVRCLGRVNRTPLVSFTGKLDAVADLCGEKLNAPQVDQALERVRAQTGLRVRFALLVPVPGAPPDVPPGYRLYLESPSDDATVARAARALDRELCGAHHYCHCRELGQLAPLAVRRVTDGWATYHGALVAQGRRSGEIKPTHFDPGGLALGAFEEQR